MPGSRGGREGLRHAALALAHPLGAACSRMQLMYGSQKDFSPASASMARTRASCRYAGRLSTTALHFLRILR